jgi:hypothetical protein
MTISKVVDLTAKCLHRTKMSSALIKIDVAKAWAGDIYFALHGVLETMAELDLFFLKGG